MQCLPGDKAEAHDEEHSLRQRECAFTLDEVEQYLTRNRFLDHDRSVDFFNKTITAEGFVITPTALVETMLESLLLSHKGEHDEKKRPQ